MQKFFDCEHNDVHTNIKYHQTTLLRMLKKFVEMERENKNKLFRQGDVH